MIQFRKIKPDEKPPRKAKPRRRITPVERSAHWDEEDTADYLIGGGGKPKPAGKPKDGA